MSNIQTVKYVSFTVDELQSLLIKCDVLEVELFAIDKVITIGASSDFDRLQGKFFDKQYYLGSNKFESIDSFFQALSSYCSNGMFYVVSIDGTNPKNYLTR